MSTAKLVAACAVSAVALSACGTSAKPVAGSVTGKSPNAGHARLDDPRSIHLPCLQAHHLPITLFGQTGIQIGQPPSGPTITFVPTPGAAQNYQITDQAEKAEVIGGALLQPNQGSDAELQVIEDCLAQGVKG
jgi:hypothetical protein